jgi:hypothetical protein
VEAAMMARRGRPSGHSPTGAERRRWASTVRGISPVLDLFTTTWTSGARRPPIMGRSSVGGIRLRSLAGALRPRCHPDV